MWNCPPNQASIWKGWLAQIYDWIYQDCLLPFSSGCQCVSVHINNNNTGSTPLSLCAIFFPVLLSSLLHASGRYPDGPRKYVHGISGSDYCSNKTQLFWVPFENLLINTVKLCKDHLGLLNCLFSVFSYRYWMIQQYKYTSTLVAEFLPGLIVHSVEEFLRQQNMQLLQQRWLLHPCCLHHVHVVNLKLGLLCFWSTMLSGHKQLLKGVVAIMLHPSKKSQLVPQVPAQLQAPNENGMQS